MEKNEEQLYEKSIQLTDEEKIEKIKEQMQEHMMRRLSDYWLVKASMPVMKEVA